MDQQQMHHPPIIPPAAPKEQEGLEWSGVGGLLAGTPLNSLNPVLVMSSVLPAAAAVPPPLPGLQPAVLKEGGLEWAGGCPGDTPFVG